MSRIFIELPKSRASKNCTAKRVDVFHINVLAVSPVLLLLRMRTQYYTLLYTLHVVVDIAE